MSSLLKSKTKRKRPDDERELITKAHALLKKVNSTSAAAADAALASLGGLAAYQAASLGGESACGGVDSSDWVKEELSNRKQPAPSSRLLDVGAIVARYDDEYNATHIDLTSKDPDVQKIDFFDFVKEAQADQVSFSTVVLSLVVNFVGSAQARGDMLKKASELLRPEGLLFFVLPAACVDNSRYLDQSLLLEILKVCGFEHLDVSHSNNGRLWRCIGRKQSDGQSSPAFDVAPFQKKRVLRGGPDRNNFNIQFSSANDDPAIAGAGSKKKAPSKGPVAKAVVLSSNQRKRLRQKKMKENGLKVESL
jgi:25S rRNA (adenine2142-N1)-methyltransferase